MCKQTLIYGVIQLKKRCDPPEKKHCHVAVLFFIFTSYIFSEDYSQLWNREKGIDLKVFTETEGRNLKDSYLNKYCEDIDWLL